MKYMMFAVLMAVALMGCEEERSAVTTSLSSPAVRVVLPAADNPRCDLVDVKGVLCVVCATYSGTAISCNWNK